MDSAGTRSLRLANLEVLINSILYNPAAALAIMESIRPRTSRLVFDKWFEAIEKPTGLPRVHDKKLSIMALCALLEMDSAAIPEPIREGWPQIVAGALHIFKDLPKSVEGKLLFMKLNRHRPQVTFLTLQPAKSLRTSSRTTMTRRTISMMDFSISARKKVVSHYVIYGPTD